MIFNIDSILEELYNLQRLGIKVGLDHTIELLKAIGNPHENLKFYKQSEFDNWSPVLTQIKINLNKKIENFKR